MYWMERAGPGGWPVAGLADGRLGGRGGRIGACGGRCGGIGIGDGQQNRGGSGFSRAAGFGRQPNGGCRRSGVGTSACAQQRVTRAG